MENSKVKMALKESYIQQKWPDSTGTLALNYDHQTGSELSWKGKVDLENTAPGDNPLFSFLVYIFGHSSNFSLCFDLIFKENTFQNPKIRLFSIN